jgi:integrase
MISTAFLALFRDHRSRSFRQSEVSMPFKSKLPRCSRNWLTEDEVLQLMKAARKAGKFPGRDAAMILITYNHGLRVSELVNLRWSDIDLRERTIYCRRLKASKSIIQRLEGKGGGFPDEASCLRRLARPGDIFVFNSMGRRDRLSIRSVHYIVARAGEVAKFPFRVHPHMLRHGCGHGLAARGKTTRDIQDILGHVDIRHTEHYTQMSPARFKEGMWRRER